MTPRVASTIAVISGAFGIKVVFLVFNCAIILLISIVSVQTPSDLVVLTCHLYQKVKMLPFINLHWTETQIGNFKLKPFLFGILFCICNRPFLFFHAVIIINDPFNFVFHIFIIIAGHDSETQELYITLRNEDYCIP